MLLLSLLVLTVSSTTDDSHGLAPIETPAALNREAPRFRFGISSTAALAGYRGGGTGGLGLSLDIGVQLTERSAFYSHTTLTTLLLASYASEDVIVERSFDSLTIGLGFGVADLVLYSNTQLVVHVPLVIAFNPFCRSENEAVRQGFRISVEAAPALALNSGRGPDLDQNLGGTFGFSLGYVRR